MADDFADVILTGLSSPSLGKVILNHAAKLKVTQTQSQTEKVTMTRSRTPRGFASGPQLNAGELMCEVGLPEEVNWVLLKQTNEYFLFSYELGDGGPRYQLADCRIEELSLEGDGEGSVQRSISFKALRHRAVPL